MGVIPVVRFSKIILVVVVFHFFYSAFLYPHQVKDLQFEHYTVEDGLSNNYITSILQDSSGFMWFGTFDALNRWDGHTFRVFKWDPTDSNSVTLGAVNALLQVSSGKIWVGTNVGLNRYDPGSEKFTRYQMEKDDPHRLYDDTIFDLYEDHSGNLWIATGIGLHRYNPDSDDFTRYMPESVDSDLNRSYNNIRCICPYRDGKILLGTTAGLITFDPKTAQFEQIPCPYELPGNPVSSGWRPIKKIIMDRQSNLWVVKHDYSVVILVIPQIFRLIMSPLFVKPRMGSYGWDRLWMV
jgi:ligand-binding sensor domain-containing protein